MGKLSASRAWSQHFLDPLTLDRPSLLYAGFADGNLLITIISACGNPHCLIFALINMVVVYFVAHNALGLAIFKFVHPQACPRCRPCRVLEVTWSWFSLSGRISPAHYRRRRGTGFDRMLGRKSSSPDKP